MRELLEKEAEFRNKKGELSYENPDPLLVAKRFEDEKIALICALFAYGNAGQIVKFLEGLDFSLLLLDEEKILKSVKNYYRFQKPLDVANLFITIKRAGSLEEIFLSGYRKQKSVLEGLKALIKRFREVNPYSSAGYDFLIGKEPTLRLKGESPYKRWNMFFRWMVRKDSLDMGLWQGVDRADLIVPLDTHTFNVSRKLGLLDRKRYDLYAAVLLTQKLKEFDLKDPVKYDFAIYRLGQQKKI